MKNENVKMVCKTTLVLAVILMCFFKPILSLFGTALLIFIAYEI